MTGVVQHRAAVVAPSAVEAGTRGTPRPTRGHRQAPLTRMRADIPAGLKLGLGVAGAAILLGGWALLAASMGDADFLLPTPAETWNALVEWYRSGDLVTDLTASLTRIGIGYSISVAIGVVVGVLLASFTSFESFFEPQMGLLRYIPASALTPLFLLWLGIDEAPKITLLALAALPPAAVATTAAVVAAPVGLQEAARALGATRRQVIRDVVVPSALPETFTGIRLAVGMAYSSVVAAELFNGLPGIGGLVKDASNYNNTPVVLVGIFAIGISGLVIDGVLRAVERRAVPWRGKI